MTRKPTRKDLFLLPSRLTNKYLIALIFFGVWMVFLDKNNLIKQFEYRSSIQVLKAEKQFYTTQMDSIRKQLWIIENETERFARETYFMHRPDEEVFLVRYKEN